MYVYMYVPIYQSRKYLHIYQSRKLLAKDACLTHAQTSDEQHTPPRYTAVQLMRSNIIRNMFGAEGKGFYTEIKESHLKHGVPPQIIHIHKNY